MKGLCLGGILCWVCVALGGGSAIGTDVFIGTGGVGHMSPAATCPFGMVQAGPDTSPSHDKYVGDWAHTSGYQFTDSYVFRFSQTHLFGTGCGSLGNVGLLPFVNSPTNGVYSAIINKRTERGEPGYYAVTIGDVNPIACEVVAGEHTSHYLFRFGKGDQMKLLIDADWGVVKPAGDRHWRPFGGRVTRRGRIHFDDALSAVGQVEVADWVEYVVSFALRFSHPALAWRRIRAEDGLRGDTYVLDFGIADGTPLEVCVGLSSTSEDAARRNLLAEMSDFDFAIHRRNASQKWEDVLSRVKLGANTEAGLAINVYSALYRLCLQPNNIADVGEPPRYSTFSLWDTYRAAHPLYTLLFPERVNDFVRSLLEQYNEQGYLPIWSLWGKDTHCMVGHHAVPVIVDAYLKGFRGFDVDLAFRAVADSLTNVHAAGSGAMWGLLKEDWPNYDKYGYIPLDGMEESPSDGRQVLGESVSRTLECAYDDSCAAQFATALKKTEEARRFRIRAGRWRNVFDPSVGFVRGRRKDGSWRIPFDPQRIGHCWWQDDDFTEGNAWQWTWHVMQDPNGLIAALGGRSKFVEKLEALFHADSRKVVTDGVCDHDVSGLIGQYAHGNEPSHHVIYFFQLAGRPDLTAKYIREVFDSQYASRPDGLCGNDDCGQMSAWYLFSAMGFYPFDPCGGEYVIGAPQLPTVEIMVRGGDGGRNKFTIVAHRLSDENKYVKSVTLNGRPITDWKVRHEEIVEGGELVFEMGAE